MRELDFSNKVVLVTGSTSGIGLATARLFAVQGASVAINGEKEDEVHSIAATMEKDGHAVLGIQTDVGDAKAVAGMVRKIMDQFGRIDAVINNAGKTGTGLLEEVKEAEWDKILETNLTGIFNVCREVVPIMRKGKSGAIINIASQALVNGPLVPGGSHYASSKGAIVSFTKYLARETGPDNIRVNAVMPGLIKTRMTENFMKQEEQYRNVLENIPLSRPGLPEEVANACLFLASDMASYITGEILAVNGGLPSILFL